MMIEENVTLLIPEGFEDDLEIITTIFNETKEVGFAIVGEDMHPDSKQPIIRIYLLANVDSGWMFQEELQAFAFWNYEKAQSFLSNLPTMSALEILMIMNSHEETENMEPTADFLS